MSAVHGISSTPRTGVTSARVRSSGVTPVGNTIGSGSSTGACGVSTGISLHFSVFVRLTARRVRHSRAWISPMYRTGPRPFSRSLRRRLARDDVRVHLGRQLVESRLPRRRVTAQRHVVRIEGRHRPTAGTVRRRRRAADQDAQAAAQLIADQLVSRSRVPGRSRVGGFVIDFRLTGESRRVGMLGYKPHRSGARDESSSGRQR